MQVARTPEKVWQLAHHLHAHEPLVQEWAMDCVFEKLRLEQIVAFASKPSVWTRLR